MLDGSEETCWNSDQGSPQYVTLDFNRKVIPSSVQIMFQGGFAGRNCAAHVLPSKDSPHGWVPLCGVFPEDVSTVQTFKLAACDVPVEQLKIVFEDSTDFYGRICIYTLDVLGVAAPLD